MISRTLLAFFTGQERDNIKEGFCQGFVAQHSSTNLVRGHGMAKTTWCDCGGRSPVANEVRYVGLMDISREENDLWNTMPVWMCR